MTTAFWVTSGARREMTNDEGMTNVQLTSRRSHPILAFKHSGLIRHLSFRLRHSLNRVFRIASLDIIRPCIGLVVIVC